MTMSVLAKLQKNNAGYKVSQDGRLNNLPKHEPEQPKKAAKAENPELAQIAKQEAKLREQLKAINKQKADIKREEAKRKKDEWARTYGLNNARNAFDRVVDKYFKLPKKERNILENYILTKLDNATKGSVKDKVAA